MDLEQLKKDTKEILVDVLEKSRLHQGQILVLGMSSSEVAGGRIGQASNIDLAEAIVQTLLDELNPGDTSVGMHVKHVQVPIRPILRELGGAHVTALASRPKLIGGARALYLDDPIRKS